MIYSKLTNNALLRELKTALQGFKEAEQSADVRMEDEYSDKIDSLLEVITERNLINEAEDIASELDMTITEVQIKKEV